MSGSSSAPSRLEAARRLFRAVLLRPAPHAILSWRYVMPWQGPEVRLHRQVFLRAWPEYPRVIWALIALCGYLPWYLCRAWLQTAAVWRRHGREVRARQGIPLGRQLRGALTLAIGHSTPPIFYYAYRLYRVPEPRWLRYVYTHELPQWHKVMSPDVSLRSGELLAHKHAFAREMADQGLPAVETRLLLRKGEPIPAPALLGSGPLFLKPEAGSRKRGCFILRRERGRYRLEGEEQAEGEEAILRILERRVGRQDYLVQPLLENHPHLRGIGPSGQLLTIRLVTARGTDRAWTVCANLEAPVDRDAMRFHSLPIEIEAGIVLRPPDDPSGEPAPPWLENQAGLRLPAWGEIVETAVRAHGAFPDVATIGWDLAITDRGVRLLEGNFNWAVAVHQLERALPMKAWEVASTSAPQATEEARINAS